jgi:hypothetical protein
MESDPKKICMGDGGQEPSSAINERSSTELKWKLEAAKTTKVLGCSKT